MTGLTRTTADLDARRKRLLFRAWHRGMREMDLIMGRFCEAMIDRFTEEELGVFEALIEVPDRDLLAWITGRDPVPVNYDTSVFAALRAFHRHDHPIHE